MKFDKIEILKGEQLLKKVMLNLFSMRGHPMKSHLHLGLYHHQAHLRPAQKKGRILQAKQNLKARILASRKGKKKMMIGLIRLMKKRGK